MALWQTASQKVFPRNDSRSALVVLFLLCAGEVLPSSSNLHPSTGHHTATLLFSTSSAQPQPEASSSLLETLKKILLGNIFICRSQSFYPKWQKGSKFALTWKQICPRAVEMSKKKPLRFVFYLSHRFWQFLLQRRFDRFTSVPHYCANWVWTTMLCNHSQTIFPVAELVFFFIWLIFAYVQDSRSKYFKSVLATSSTSQSGEFKQGTKADLSPDSDANAMWLESTAASEDEVRLILKAQGQ